MWTSFNAVRFTCWGISLIQQVQQQCVFTVGVLLTVMASFNFNMVRACAGVCVGVHVATLNPQCNIHRLITSDTHYQHLLHLWIMMSIHVTVRCACAIAAVLIFVTLIFGGNTSLQQKKIWVLFKHNTGNDIASTARIPVRDLMINGKVTQPVLDFFQWVSTFITCQVWTCERTHQSRWQETTLQPHT